MSLHNELRSIGACLWHRNFDLVYYAPIDRALNFVASATWCSVILAELIENFQRQNRQYQLGR